MKNEELRELLMEGASEAGRSAVALREGKCQRFLCETWVTS